MNRNNHSPTAHYFHMMHWKGRNSRYAIAYFFKGCSIKIRKMIKTNMKKSYDDGENNLEDL
jgi:hypothetical protein